ncbi:MAG TPA: chemotaxis protein CheD [Bacillota bacterium]|nr:chemotaxis protein CheD [Bacillota bacterium]
MVSETYRITPVKIAETKVSRDKDEVLVAYSLGSCIGLALWDCKQRAGGLSHVFLPQPRDFEYIAASGNSESGPGFVCKTRHNEQPGKYGSTAVPHLVSELIKIGCRRHNLQAILVGGANVIPGLSSPFGQIGQLNLQAVKGALAMEGIKIVGEDTGGNHGRSIYFNLNSGVVKVTSVTRPEKELRFEE